MVLNVDPPTYPLAMAPTKTAIECDSGKVGKNFDNLTVGASADRAETGISTYQPRNNRQACIYPSLPRTAKETRTTHSI